MSKNKKLVIITGINRGLGKALFNQIMNREDFFIFGITRKINNNQKLLFEKNSFDYCIRDFLYEPEPIAFDNIIKGYSELIFINNAFTIEPMDFFRVIKRNEIKESISINILSPLMILNNLVKSLNEGQHLKIINISSGASSRAIKGWGLYCSSKSFNEMFFKCLDFESNIETHSIDPGVIDTKMQKKIRSNSIKDFDWVDYFKSVELLNPNDVAKKIIDKYL